jgi:UDP-3-O-[3-hydroxymyristoyl] N-acetylglucosamine deacetylase
MGIDNVYVEIDNLEVPILDGSGLPFVRLIEQAGIRQYRRKRRYLRIRRPIFGGGQGQAHQHHSRRSFPPDLRYGLSRPGGPPVLELEVTPERYASELAFARTFGWENDLDQMRNMGLIRGASLENAVCFTSQGPMNPGGLRARTSAAATRRWISSATSPCWAVPSWATSSPSAPDMPCTPPWWRAS